jgi:hypothetical protein
LGNQLNIIASIGTGLLTKRRKSIRIGEAGQKINILNK